MGKRFVNARVLRIVFMVVAPAHPIFNVNASSVGPVQIARKTVVVLVIQLVIKGLAHVIIAKISLTVSYRIKSRRHQTTKLILCGLGMSCELCRAGSYGNATTSEGCQLCQW